MSACLSARTRIRDETLYRKYLDEAGLAFERYEGDYVAADTAPSTLEG
jgi:uncharacterized protein (DUF1330 family)